jgi:putative membrane protein
MARKAASGQELTDAELEKLIRHYPGESSSQQGNPSENAEPVPDTLKADSGKILAGYYKNEKHIEINDAQLYPWMEEIEEHLNNYTGWTVTMKGQVVTDPSLFEPGTFSPTRKLMTCCVADLSLIGFTCLYDMHGPYAELVRDDTWVTVTGIITAGTYQGEPEPQIQCTEIKEAAPPENPYLYP